MSSNTECVERDERTVAVENAGYRWAYALLAYALLVDVMYRSLVRREAAWDLMALVIAGGVVCTLYQARYKVLSRGWVGKVVLAALAAAVIAALVAMAL
jgi:hypothetical protein